MKINLLVFLLIVSCIYLFTACNKEKITQLPPDPITTLSADSNYLSKIYFLRGNGSNIDTSTNIFIYDNLKRVSQYLETYTNNTNGVITKHYDTSKFFYTGSETLPNRIIKVFKNPIGIPDTLTNYLSYSNNRIIRDSAVSGNINSGTKISTFTYVGIKTIIYSSITYLNLPSNNYTIKDTLTQDANSNIIAKNSFIEYGINSPNNSSSITTYTYGNNPSPLINLNICNKLGKFEISDHFLYQGSKNNLTSLTVSSYSNGIQVNVIVTDNMDTYVFKTNGYPYSLNFQFPLNPQTRKLIYKYVSL